MCFHGILIEYSILFLHALLILLHNLDLNTLFEGTEIRMAQTIHTKMQLDPKSRSDTPHKQTRGAFSEKANFGFFERVL